MSNGLTCSILETYLNSTFLGHSAASDILQHFNEETRVLNLSKMLHVSMNGPSTNMKFSKELSEYRFECESWRSLLQTYSSQADSFKWGRRKILSICFKLLMKYSLHT